MLDEMAQALGGISGKMKDIVEMVFSEDFFYKSRIRYRAFDKIHAIGHIVAKAAAQIVQAHNPMIGLEQMPAHVRANESSRAGDQNARTHPKSLRICITHWLDFFGQIWE